MARSTHSPATVEEALLLLRSLGATAWLVRHHELVAEAARELVEGLGGALRFDTPAVLVGAALHDAGKVLYPAEMSGPGSEHETAGEALLLDRGVSPTLARFCRTHPDPARPGAGLEDLLVALADKLWKGKRIADLEALLAAELEAQGCERWRAFALVDDLCERIADGGEGRLARSAVGRLAPTTRLRGRQARAWPRSSTTSGHVPNFASSR